MKSIITHDAKFEFHQLQSDNYYLQISSDETVQTEKPFYLEKDLDLKIIYELKVQQIEEVHLVGKKNSFKVENGNITLEVANSPLNKLPSSIELLSKLPFVMMDANDERVSSFNL